MKRLIFFFLLVVCISVVSYLVLFTKYTEITDYGDTLFDYLKSVFEAVKSGSWAWSDINAVSVFTYGLVAFLFINGVLLLSILVMAFTTLFKFSKVYRFYGTVGWYVIAALLLTGALAYMAVALGGNLMDTLLSMPWQLYFPLWTSIVLFVIGSIFKNTELI